MSAVSLAFILEQTAKAFDVSGDDLKGRSAVWTDVRARFVYCGLDHAHTLFTCGLIGKAIRRGPKTAEHGRRRFLEIFHDEADPHHQDFIHRVALIEGAILLDGKDVA